MYVIKIFKGKTSSSPEGEKGLWNEGIRNFVSTTKEATLYKNVGLAHKAIANMGKEFRRGKIIGIEKVDRISVPETIEVPKIEPTEKLLYQVGDFKRTVMQGQGMIRQLKKNLKYLELEQQDLLHYAENYNFSASEGYKVLKRLKTVREERRKIKNALEFLGRVGNLDAEQLDKINIEQLDRHPEKYNPRVLKEMFEEKEEQIRRRNART